jgi:hypothetical protein
MGEKEMSNDDGFVMGFILGVLLTVLVVVSLIHIGTGWQLKALDCHSSYSTGANSYICYRVEV